MVVVAAGNAGAGPNTIGSPAAAEFAITVGAAGEWSADPNGPISIAWHTAGMFSAPFSGRGPTRDGRIKPDVMAPGVSIASALGDYTGLYYLLYGCDNDCYTAMSGTSMASPYMAGAAALILQADSTLSPAELGQIVFNTAQDRTAVAGKDNDTGYGLLDVYAAVAQASLAPAYDPTAFPDYVMGSGSVGKNKVTRIPIEVTYTDAPLAITVTINGNLGNFGWNPDLEARLLDADGNPFVVPNPYWPILGPEFVPRPGTLSTCPGGDFCGAAGRQETIYFAPPTVGTYILEVFPYPDWPNRGKGGSFTYEVSRGPVEAGAPPPPEALVSDAGPDQTVTDADDTGDESVNLDGGGSSGTITSYVWTENGNVIATGITPTVPSLTVGTHNIMLTVTDTEDATGTDTRWS